jgi:hypothetical protein
MELAGESFGTTKTIDTLLTSEIGAKDFRVSYGSLENKDGFVTCDGKTISRVYPSAGEVATN